MLILDGYESHISSLLLDWLDDKRVILACLLSHTSHFLQPLDVGLFGPLQKAYGKRVGELSTRGHTSINKPLFLEILTDARQEVYTTRNARGAWRGSGIWPHNPHVVLSKLPSNASDVEEPTTPPSTLGSDPRTPRTDGDVEKALRDAEISERSPGTVRRLVQLGRGVKRAVMSLA